MGFQQYAQAYLAVCTVMACALFGCATESSMGPDDGLESGKFDQNQSASPIPDLFRPGNRYAAALDDHYVDEVQPVLSSRCAVCHACTNGPCQLNMTSFAALERGISQTNPYDFGLRDTAPTRVSDNRSLEAWRAQGFQTVLPTGSGDPADSMFYRSLVHGITNQAIDETPWSELTTAEVRRLAQRQLEGDYVCPSDGRSFDDFMEDEPNGGMPWALPTMRNAEFQTLTDWVLGGAPAPSVRALSVLRAPETTPMTQIPGQRLVDAWEEFLNADDHRSQLVARYIYEHVFLANLHLDENPGEFYKLVRSRTAPGQTIDRIQTKLPMDDPGVARVFYRLEKIDRVIEAKSHNVWRISLEDLEHLRALFLGGNWDVAGLPGYESPNPFEYFAAIPAAARSQFLRENSRMIIGGVARGPICMVQGATWAVDEYFWIWFMDPEADPSVQSPQLGLEDWDAFYGKDQNLSTSLSLGSKFGEPIYREAFERELRALRPDGLGLDDIWNGEGGENPNAFLVVHRHQTTTEVTHGGLWPMHAEPRSVVLLSFANLERIYYNGAARYKYWGSLGHQNDAYNYQQYTRTEGEDLYVSLLANPDLRASIRDRYTSTGGSVYQRLGRDYAEGRDARTPEHWDEQDLHTAVFEYLGSEVTGPADTLNHYPYDDHVSEIADSIADRRAWENGIRSLTAREGTFASFVPNLAVIRVGDLVYTLIANRGYRPDKTPGVERLSRQREHDTVLAIRGLYGAHPHLFFDLAWDEAADFLRDLSSVQNQDDWNAVYERYAVARNSSAFWPFLDFLHRYQAEQFPIEAGILEIAAYDRDDRPF